MTLLDLPKRKRRRKKSHPNWPVRLVLLGLLLSFVVVAIFIPVFRFRLQANELQRERWDLLNELILTHTMSWFIGLWVFFFGACLGSFLNVVAYRIPNGMTILGSSRCPWCLVPIESRYNFPILGWLLLRGRCAACRIPISVRYVIVEIIAGLILVWLFVFELAANGQNLPRDYDYNIGLFFKLLASGNIEDLWSQDWSLLRIFFLHCMVAYTLLTAALMRLDRLKLPPIWKGVHLVAAALFIAIWPADFEFARPDFKLIGGEVNWYERLEFQIRGLCIGGFLGFQYQMLPSDRHSGLYFAMTLIGLSCGWIAALSIGTIFLAMYGTVKLMRHNGFLSQQPLFLLLFSFLLQIAAWEFLDRQTYWPNNSANTLVFLAFLMPGALAAVFVTSNRRANPSEHEQNDPPDENGDPTEKIGAEGSSTEEPIAAESDIQESDAQEKSGPSGEAKSSGTQ